MNPGGAERVTSAATDSLLVTTNGAVRTLTLNRPARLNAINGDVSRAIAAALDEAEADDSVGAIILTGSPRLDGRQCFSAGGDVKAQAEGGASSLGERPHDVIRDVAGAYAGDYLGSRGGRANLRRIETFPKIVVAAVGGVCVGGGLELALSCDLVVVADSAQLGDPHVTLHSFTSGGGLTNTLTRHVGAQKAKELVLLGGLIDGNEAVRIGLANRVVPAEALIAETEKIAAAIAGLDPVAAQMTKVLANAAPDIDRERGLRFDSLVWSVQMTQRGGQYRGAVEFLAERETRKEQGA
jgi:enoyl-CoA hydratase/carnithine racemase